VSCAHHIQSEVCLVEVVDQNGRPCQPGEVGEVAITTLHNFVMPLIRYATGDLARNLQGLDGRPGPCACGRTLPLIERVPAAEKRANRAPAV
jgi:phenylacetate-CoA ligase